LKRAAIKHAITAVPEEAMKDTNSSLETVIAQDRLLRPFVRPEEEPVTVFVQFEN